MKSHVFIFYGFPIDIEISNWKELICEKLNLKSPTVDFKSNKDLYKEYWSKKDKLIKDLGVSVEVYGSLSEPKYCVSVNDSLIMCPGEFLQKLNPLELVFVKEWEKKIKKFCRLLPEIQDNLSQASWLMGMYTEGI